VAIQRPPSRSGSRSMTSPSMTRSREVRHSKPSSPRMQTPAAGGVLREVADNVGGQSVAGGEGLDPLAVVAAESSVGAEPEVAVRVLQQGEDLALGQPVHGRVLAEVELLGRRRLQRGGEEHRPGAGRPRPRHAGSTRVIRIHRLASRILALPTAGVIAGACRLERRLMGRTLSRAPICGNQRRSRLSVGVCPTGTGPPAAPPIRRDLRRTVETSPRGALSARAGTRRRGAGRARRGRPP